MSASRSEGGPLLHHDLCFGCGRTNLFGLLAELEEAADGRVLGRCFIKQDHQGPDQGNAHPGVIVAALVEAMSLAGGKAARTLHVEFEAAAPIGGFLELEASRESAIASVHGQTVARARASYG